VEKLRLDEMMEFRDDFVVKRLADIPEAQINLVTLPPGQALPAHNANSNVRLLPLAGAIVLTASGERIPLAVHEMIAFDFGTPMQIANEGRTHAAFLVIKTPNPSEME